MQRRLSYLECIGAMLFDIILLCHFMLCTCTTIYLWSNAYFMLMFPTMLHFWHFFWVLVDSLCQGSATSDTCATSGICTCGALTTSIMLAIGLKVLLWVWNKQKFLRLSRDMHFDIIRKLARCVQKVANPRSIPSELNRSLQQKWPCYHYIEFH